MYSQQFQSQRTHKPADPLQQPFAHRSSFPRPDLEPTDGSDQVSRRSGWGSRTHYYTNAQHDDLAAKGWHSVRNPNNENDASRYHTTRETPELMRKKQEELLRAARVSSELAASVEGKPTSPQLHPCQSPKGAVTPLTLGQAEDHIARKDSLRQ